MLDYKDLVDSYLKVQRLACEGELHRHLFRGRPDPEQQRRDYRQLLAQRNLRRGNRRRAPQRGHPSARPVHADRLLRRLVAQAADPGGPGRRGRQDHLHARPSTWPRCATRWSTSWASCRTNGRARRRSPPSIPTWLPLSRWIILTYYEVKKCIESFIYGVNTPSRWGTQAPFSNITLDWTVPNDLAEHARHRRRQGDGFHL